MLARQLAPCVLALGLVSGGDPVQDEWRVRRWALDPAEYVSELRIALEHEHWTERALALDAAGRALASGTQGLEPLRETLSTLLADGHPNVRASAVRVVAALGAVEALTPGEPSPLCEDVFSGVRLEFARGLAKDSTEQGAGALELLAQDLAPQVRRAARAAQVFAGVAPSMVGATEEQLLEVARWSQRAPVPLASTDSLFSADPAAQALVAALDYVHSGAGDAHALLDGWIGPGDWDPRRQELLAGAASSADEGLGRAALAALDAVQRANQGDAEPLKAWPALAAAFAGREASGDESVLFHLPHELSELALAALGSQGVVELLYEQPAGRELHPVTLAFLLPLVAYELPSWSAEHAARWIDPTAPRALRLAALEAFSITHSASADSGGAGLLLARALVDADEFVSRRAFRALCEGPGLERFAAELHAAWAELEPKERLDRLAWLPRDVALEPFTAALFALGEEGGRSRGVAVELLRAWIEREPVQARVSRWLVEDLDRFESSRAQDRRALEFLIKGELRTLARLAPAAGAALFERALRVSFGASDEIGKTAVWALGESVPGRVRLVPLFEELRGRSDSRARIEAGIVLAGGASVVPPPPTVVPTLLADYAGCDWALRSRMLRALQGSESALLFLERIVFDATAEDEERDLGLGVLVATLGSLERGEERVALLGRVWKQEGSLNLKKRAVSELVRLPGQGPARLLFEAFVDLMERDPSGGGGERLSPAAEYLRGPILLALARRGAHLDEVQRVTLVRPMARARADLELRFRSLDPPSVSFSFGDELELVELLARAGRLASLLDDAGPWGRLDGHVLSALGARLESIATEDAALAAQVERIDRAALIACLGDREPDQEELGRIRFRMLGRSFRAGEWERFEELAHQLLFDHMLRRLPDEVWQENLGRADARTGVDPRARLSSATHQARAWAALERGDETQARELVDRASSRLGRSREARAEQQRLEAALASGSGTGD